MKILPENFKINHGKLKSERIICDSFMKRLDRELVWTALCTEMQLMWMQAIGPRDSMQG